MYCARQKNVGPAGPFNPAAWIDNFVNVCVKKTKHDRSEFMCMYMYASFCNCVLTYLAMMCIFVIYKCNKLGQQSTAGSGQAKPSYWWEAALRPIPWGEWKYSVCFEKRAKMASFAAVLPMLGYSSMYETECEIVSRNVYCMLITYPIFLSAV